MDYELETIDSELKLYARYMYELVSLSDRMNDLQMMLSSSSYGVSSPRIKSIQEAKYKQSPKVYMEDAALNWIEDMDHIRKELKVLRMEYSLKRIFCLKMMEKICAADLDPEEIQILWLRYFKGMSLRGIAEEMWSNKDRVSRILSETISRIL